MRRSEAWSPASDSYTTSTAPGKLLDPVGKLRAVAETEAPQAVLKHGSAAQREEIRAAVSGETLTLMQHTSGCAALSVFPRDREARASRRFC